MNKQLLAIEAPKRRTETYQYRDEFFNSVWITQMPQNDNAAVEHLLSHTMVMFGAVYVERVTHFNGPHLIGIPLRYKREGDELVLWP